jgi:hypothetical protein
LKKLKGEIRINGKVSCSFWFKRESCSEKEMELMCLIWCGWTMARFGSII